MMTCYLTHPRRESRVIEVTGMVLTIQPERFRFEDKPGKGVAGKRVLITGAGKEGGLGQAFATRTARE